MQEEINYIDNDNKEYNKNLDQFINELWSQFDEKLAYEKMLKVFIAQGLKRIDLDIQEFETKQELFIERILAMQGAFQTAFLLQELHKSDPVVAQEAAKRIWNETICGDSYGEFLWEWAIKNDVPVKPQTLDGLTQEEYKFKMERTDLDLLRFQQIANHILPLVLHMANAKEEISAEEAAKTLTGITQYGRKEIMKAMNLLLNDNFIEIVKNPTINAHGTVFKVVENDK